MDHAVRPSQALSLPNILTYARLVAVPVMAAVMFFFSGAIADWTAFGIFAFAGVTDFFDGYLARAWQQQSPLGKMLDPIADKLLIGTAILMLVFNKRIDGWAVWAALIILSREMLVSGLREFLAELNAHKAVRVSILAKWKTTVQILALGFLLVGETGYNATGLPTITIGLVLLWLAALLTLYTGMDYFRAGIRVMNR
jgi:CDP-diacylglycerol--glycerol-3-phosphate 3-phosphatidyltransferase/cardiolipin synthase